MKIPPRTPPKRRRTQSGATLAATMLVVAAIATFLSIAATITSQFGRYAGHGQGTGMEATFCDAALEYAYSQWKASAQVSNGLGAGNVPLASTFVPASLKSGFLAAFPGASQLGVDLNDFNAVPKSGQPDSFRIEAVDQNGQNENTLPYSSSKNAVSFAAGFSQGVPPGVQTQNVPGYPGWGGANYNYMAVVRVHSLHYGMDSSFYEARRYFQVTRMPLCQALAFYEGNLEIHPGATMVMNGPVHSNAKIWAQGFAPLSFTNNISHVQGYFDGTSNPDVKLGWDGKNTAATNPDPYKPYYPVTYKDGLPDAIAPAINGWRAQAIPAGSAFVTQVNAVSSINPFGPDFDPSNNGLRTIIQVPPTTNTSDQIAYNNASLIIEVNSNVLVPDPTQPLTVNTLLNPTQIPSTAINISVRNPSTGVVTPISANDPDPKNVADYNNVMTAINKGLTTPIQDQREAAKAYVTNLDMGLLANATTMPASITPGGSTASASMLQQAFNRNTTISATTGKTVFVQGGTVYIHDISGRTGSTRGAIRLTDGNDLKENVTVASDNGVYIQGDYNTGKPVGTNVIPSDQPGAVNGTQPSINGYTRYASSVMADAVTVLSNSWQDSNSGAALSVRAATPTTVNTAILSGDVASNTNGDKIASGGVHNFPRFLEDWSPKNVNFTYYGSLIEAFNSKSYTGVWQTNSVYSWPNRLWNFDTQFSVQQPPGMPQGLICSRGRWERTYLDY